MSRVKVCMCLKILRQERMLLQWFPKCGPQTGNINIIWELTGDTYF